MKDTTKHQGLRNKLAILLQTKGITDNQVLSVIKKIPRHLFMDSSFEAHAYQNKAFPIAAEQTISTPYTVAFQTQALALKEAEKVLEIGTGSGYQTAVLIALKTKVYTVERQHELFKKATLFLPKLGYSATKQVFGDGYKGLPEYAPFDKILVTAGAPYVPKPLLTQLTIGGRMIIPLGSTMQTMTLFTRKSATVFKKQELGSFKFVPMLKKTV